jgi:hypothetical protein
METEEQERSLSERVAAERAAMETEEQERSLSERVAAERAAAAAEAAKVEEPDDEDSDGKRSRYARRSAKLPHLHDDSGSVFSSLSGLRRSRGDKRGKR